MLSIKFVSDEAEQIFETDSVRASRKEDGGMVVFHRPPHHKYLEETHLGLDSKTDYHTAFVMNDEGKSIAIYRAERRADKAA